MILLVAVIVIIYTMVAAAIFIAAGVISGDRDPGGSVGVLLRFLTDSDTLLVAAWVSGCLLIIADKSEHL